MGKETIRPVGTLKTSTEGKSHIPEIIRKEVGLEIGKAGEIPYFLDANCVLLARKGASLENILLGLDILKEDLKLRTQKELVNSILKAEATSEITMRKLGRGAETQEKE